jgi:ribosomal protein S25
MGGKKRLNLKQMERAQSKQGKEEKKKKDKKAVLKEKKPASIIAPDHKNEKIVGELRKLPVLTPFIVASRLNLRISAAKDFLDQLEDRGIVQMVDGNHNLKIYKSAA